MDESSPPPEEPSSTSQLDSPPVDKHPPPSNDSPTEEDHSGSDRAAKRRKKCPESLDKIQKSRLPNRTHSFTFDTKFTASPPDSTPKFGSFKIPPPEADPGEKEQEQEQEEAEAADDGEEAAEDGGEFEDAVKLVNGLLPVNGIVEN